MVDDQDMCEWVNVFFLVPAHPGRPGHRAVKRLLLLLLQNTSVCQTDGQTELLQ